MSVLKLVTDSENWQWQTVKATGFGASEVIKVQFPQGTPTERLVALRLVLLDENGDPFGDFCKVSLYKKSDKQEDLWPNNSRPWAVTVRSGDTETIAWTKLSDWSSMDQILFGIESGPDVRGASVSILVKSSVCGTK
jgi:hypothetical protein